MRLCLCLVPCLERRQNACARFEEVFLLLVVDLLLLSLLSLLLLLLLLLLLSCFSC